MKAASLILIALCLACGTAPKTPQSPSSVSTASTQSGNSNAEAASKSLSIDEERARNILEQATVAPDLEASAQTPAVIPTNTTGTFNPGTAPVDFMTATEQGIFKAFGDARSKSGQQLSEAQAQILTQSLMSVIAAAQTKNPLTMMKAWNNFTDLTRKMNKEAKAKAQANGGLIQDLVDLAQDILDLVPDLVIAVLQLDVAGVIDVAVDLVALLIDFLI